MSTPHHIIRKSRKWHLNTISGKYIAQANLDATVARERIARQEAVDRDAVIRRARWDLLGDD